MKDVPEYKQLIIPYYFNIFNIIHLKLATNLWIRKYTIHIFFNKPI